MRWHSLVGRCTVFFCSCSLSKASESSPTPPYSQQHWPLSLVERSKEEGHLPCCSQLPEPWQLLETLHVRMSLETLDIHLSFLWLTFSSWSKIFSSQKNQSISVSWCSNKHFAWIKWLFFIFVDMNWSLYVT